MKLATILLTSPLVWFISSFGMFTLCGGDINALSGCYVVGGIITSAYIGICLQFIK